MQRDSLIGVGKTEFAPLSWAMSLRNVLAAFQLSFCFSVETLSTKFKMHTPQHIKRQPVLRNAIVYALTLWTPPLGPYILCLQRAPDRKSLRLNLPLGNFTVRICNRTSTWEYEAKSEMVPSWQIQEHPAWAPQSSAAGTGSTVKPNDLPWRRLSLSRPELWVLKTSDSAPSQVKNRYQELSSRFRF
jgi:hypothetical protein